MRFGFHHHRHERGCGPRHGGMRGRGFAAMAWNMEEGEGGRRRRRVFDGGELRLVLLKLIADQPRHGYDLIRAIEELTGGAYAPSPGVVYPTVTLLADMDLIEETPGQGGRKAYAATDAGRAHLDAHKEDVEALFARLAALAEVRERTDAMPVKRAMQNLRNVLRHRLGGEDVSNETIHEVVALLDEAARKIERL